MRATKIDELPQLLNCVLGDMAIVGPRPAAQDQVVIMREGKYGIAARVRPGLTGPAALYDYLYGDTVEDPAEGAGTGFRPDIKNCWNMPGNRDWSCTDIPMRGEPMRQS